MREKVIDKIRKLLALAQSPNPNEAALAASKAARLMADHEIEEAELEAKGEAQAEPVGAHELYRTGKYIAWQGVLCMGVASSMGVKFYVGHGGRYMIIGPASKVESIKYTVSYLVRTVDGLAKDAWDALDYLDKQGKNARIFGSAFRMGAAETIYRRLHAESEVVKRAAREHASCQALMVIDRQSEAIERYGKEVIKLRSRQGSTAGRGDYNARNAGRKAGESVSLGGGRAIGAGQRRIGA